METPNVASITLTVVGLFDDEIDAEHALDSLRKAERPSASISVLARDRSGNESKNRTIDVTKAVMDSAMSSVSGWLTGLATLMVPDHGTVLAAGPIGGVLAKMKPEPKSASGLAPDSEIESQAAGSIGLAFEQFGFTADEAHYLEQRLAAGSVVIAVTAADQNQVASTLRTFGDFEAVFIGQAETSVELVAEAERWIAHPLSASEPEVIVADLVVTLRRVCSGPRDDATFAAQCGLPVIDESGESPGEIDDILIDASDDGLVRYVIVGHGGILGIARHRYAIPGELCRFESEQVALLVGRDKLDDAPAYDPGTPFSRKDELAAHQYFETKPYWIE